MGDPLWFFTHLGGFDHAVCDAALRAKQVDIRSIDLHKGSADTSIYGGAAAFAGWIVWMSFILRRMFSRWWMDNASGNPRTMWRAVGIAVFSAGWIAVACVAGTVQVTGVTQYMGTCRALLSAK